MSGRRSGESGKEASASAQLRRTAAWARENPRRLLAAAALLAAAIWLGRGCIPGVGANQLPPAVIQQIVAHYQTCIGIDETAIWPGEPRQPGCGQVEVRVLGRGVVPLSERAAGTSVAVCYRVRMDNPTWSTQGQTRHELVWSQRVVYRVATFQEGAWVLELGREAADEDRWARFRCPERPPIAPDG
jgi:hypothetical protein